MNVWQEAQQRAQQRAHQTALYLGCWQVLFLCFVVARAGDLFLTPWPIVLAPLWFGPALLVAGRLSWSLWRFLRALWRGL